MQKNNIRASIYMMLAMAGFTLNDSIIKSIDGELNTGQVLLVRGCFASGFLLLLTLKHHLADVRERMAGKLVLPSPFLPRLGVTHPLVLWRGIFDIAATLTFLTALLHLPFANLLAIVQALPLVVTLGAAIFLREAVGWRRWLAIGIGFMGVLIIVRPGLHGFSIYTLLALLAVVAAAARDLVTRGVPVAIPSLVVALVSSVMVTLAGALLALPLGGWETMSLLHWSKLILAALFISVGYHGVVLAMRMGEISFVAPFRYVSLLWALIIGAFVFDEIPDWATLVGALLVVVSGLYAFYREHSIRKM